MSETHVKYSLKELHEVALLDDFVAQKIITKEYQFLFTKAGKQIIEFFNGRKNTVLKPMRHPEQDESEWIILTLPELRKIAKTYEVDQDFLKLAQLPTNNEDKGE